MEPLRLILVGFILVLVGAILPFLMVARILEASFTLSFLSYGASVAGLFMGIMGAALYVRGNRR